MDIKYTARPNFEILQLEIVTQERCDLDAKEHIKRLNATSNVAHLKFPNIQHSSLCVVEILLSLVPEITTSLRNLAALPY